MALPNNQKGVLKFIDLVKYYNKMWEKFLNTFQTLTKLTSSKVRLKRRDAEQKIFDNIKYVVACYTSSYCQDFNK